MTHYFDVKRYQEILKLNEKNPEMGYQFQLLGFFVEIETNIYFSFKEQYLKLVKEYLDKVISPCKFRETFLNLKKENVQEVREIMNDFDRLSKFLVINNFDIDQFSEFIFEINHHSLKFDEDQRNVTVIKTKDKILEIEEDQSQYVITEEDFYNLIKNCYLEYTKIEK